MKNTLRMLFTLLMTVLIGAALATFLEIHPLWMIGAMIVASFLPRPSGILAVSLIDLARPSGSNPGAGGGIKSEIILIPEENVSAIGARAADGVTISSITLKAGKYMKRFYMTDDVIEPGQKKIKGGNVDSGGWECSLKGFHPGFGAAVMSWIANYGYSFKGYVIFRNCADNTAYLLGEPCNLVHVDDIQAKWGSTVDKERGQEITFSSRQKNPLAIYTGAIVYDPTSASW